MANHRHRILTSGKAAVSIALLAWLLSRTDVRSVGALMLNAQFGWLATAASLPFLGLWLTSVRWRGLLQVQGIALPLRFLFRSCMVAIFVRQFLPSIIGGDAYRIYDTWKAGGSKSAAVSSLAVDRLAGLVALCLFALGAVWVPNELTRKYPQIVMTLVSGTGLLVLALGVLLAPLSTRPRHLPSWLARVPGQRSASTLLRALRSYRNRPRQLVVAVLLSLILQVNVVTFYYCISRAMSFAVPYTAHFLIVPVAVLVMMLPISINGIGVREGIFVLLLGAFAVQPTQAIAFAWIEHGIFLLYGMVGGTVYAGQKCWSAWRLASPASDLAREVSAP